MRWDALKSGRIGGIFGGIFTVQKKDAPKMPISDAKLRKLKAKIKPYKVADEGGLYVEVATSGSRLWRWKYRYGEKEKRLALGKYPDVSLADARAKRDQYRATLAKGIDPGILKKQIEKADSALAVSAFEIVAREWYAVKSPKWVPAHGGRIIRRLERDIFPWIGARPVAELTPPEILEVLRRIEKRGAVETAHRALQDIGQVLRYGVATGHLTSDPSRDLKGALATFASTNFAAVTDPMQVGALLRLIEDYKGTLTVRAALRLHPHVFTRSGELTKAEWSEFDLEAGIWSIPAERMKMRQAHVVPLSRQALAILREIHPFTGSGRYVFPGPRYAERPITVETLLACYRRSGINKDVATCHGWRATARTLLHEQLGFPPEVIEHQLAHAVGDANGTSYNRTKFIDARKGMMQAWSDHLDHLRDGAEIVPFGKKTG